MIFLRLLFGGFAFWDFLAGKDGLVGGFKDPSASLLRRLSNGLVSYLCWFCNDVVAVFEGECLAVCWESFPP